MPRAQASPTTKLSTPLYPQLIKYYLDQEALIPNVPSYLCMFEDDRKYVLDNLDQLVVKPANESGGYGMMIGPHVSKKERKKFAELIKADPRNYMAQPTLALSTSPTIVGARHGGTSCGFAAIHSFRRVHLCHHRRV
jgi:uncharacterized circularly permuted ATP-grasp superfamily protein